jgi:hypothetical protein
LAEDAVCCEPVSDPNSLINRQYTGKFHNNAPDQCVWSIEKPREA